MKKINITNRWFALLAICCVCFAPAFGQTIEITDVAGLRALRSDANEAADKSYILMNDIDLAGETWTESQLVWSFKGTFDGNGHVIKNFTFNGTTSDATGFFRYVRGTVKNLGFENASVNGASNGNGTGIIVGGLRGGILENCWVINSTVTKSADRLGGLVGNADKDNAAQSPKIINCRVLNTSVTGTGLVGGIVGRTCQSTIVEKCYAEKATIYGNGDVGGVVGRLFESILKLSYSSDCSISGNDNVGGVLGRLFGSTSTSTIIENCYSSADVTSRSYQAGGVVGQATDNGISIISNCYFSGKLTRNGTNRAGGIMALVGVDNKVTIENCVNLAAEVISSEIYRITSLNGKTATLTNNYALESLTNTHGGASENGISISAGMAKTQSFYLNTLGWDFNDNWILLKDGYPVLKWQTASGLAIKTPVMNLNKTYVLQNGESIDLNKIITYNGVRLSYTKNSNKINIVDNIVTPEGTINSLERVTVTISAIPGFILDKTVVNIVLMPAGIVGISTPEDLELVNSNSTKSFELKNNIDMSGIAFTGLCTESVPFTGTFDGKGYVISGLSYDNESTGIMGLFRKTKGATIKNLGIENANFKGGSDIGGIVGIAEGGKIEQCYVNNSSVNANDRAGGIAGRVLSGIQIEDCYVNALITGRSHQLGGIAAAAFSGGAKIKNCYFVGELQGGGHGGAMIGLIDQDGDVYIENCLNLSSFVTGYGPYRICSWGSRESYAHFTNNYSVSTTLVGSNLSTAVVVTDGTATNRNGLNLSDDADAKSSAFYSGTLTWNFTDVWTFDGGNDYPVLKVFKMNSPVQTQSAECLYTVCTSNGTICISNLEENTVITIYNIYGQLVTKEKASGEYTYQLPAKGLYIVKIVAGVKESVAKVVNK